jgi:hypothetical protein
VTDQPMTRAEWRLRAAALSARFKENERGFDDLAALAEEGVPVTPALRARARRYADDLDRIVGAMEAHLARRPDDG